MPHLAPEYERSSYMIGGPRRRAGVEVWMFTNDRKCVGQGTWVVGGVPSGGFNIHPIEWLDEERRKRAEAEGKP